MSALTETTAVNSTAATRLPEDPQPSPKRRKNSASKSQENGYKPDELNSTLSSPATSTTTTTKLTTSNSNTSKDTTVSATSTSTATTTTATTRITRSAAVNGTTDKQPSGMKEESKSTNGNTADKSKGQSMKRNQFGELSDGHMTLGDWLEQWRKGKTRFTMKVPHRMLVKHIDRLTEGKKHPSFFLPCCGKTLDMKWLLDRGYSVTGVEIAEQACREFFEEQGIKYETETITDGLEGKLFKGVDHDIRIYACDLFSVTTALIGQFDCIWDRGSYAAMNPCDRSRYADVISKLLKPDGRYLLDCFEVEHSVFAGPPHTTEPGELDKLFDMFNVDQLEHVDAMGDWQKQWGVKYFYENDFLLTPKKK